MSQDVDTSQEIDTSQEFNTSQNSDRMLKNPAKQPVWLRLCTLAYCHITERIQTSRRNRAKSVFRFCDVVPIVFFLVLDFARLRDILGGGQTTERR